MNVYGKAREKIVVETSCRFNFVHAFQKCWFYGPVAAYFLNEAYIVVPCKTVPEIWLLTENSEAPFTHMEARNAQSLQKILEGS